MSDVRSVKRRMAIVLAIGAVVSVSSAVWVLGRVSKHFSTGATGVIEIRDDVLPDGSEAGDTTWLDDVWKEGRLPDPATKRAVAQVYARAWSEITAGIAGTSKGVDPTFVGPALLALQAQPPPARTVGARSHELQLRFYADDGASIGLRAQTVSLVAQSVAGATIHQSSHDSYDVVMTLSDDATWRIRQWQRVSVAPASTRVEVLPPQKSFPYLKVLLLAVLMLMALRVAYVLWRRRRRRRKALAAATRTATTTDGADPRDGGAPRARRLRRLLRRRRQPTGPRRRAAGAGLPWLGGRRIRFVRGGAGSPDRAG